MPDAEYRALTRAAQRRGQTVAEVVRESLRRTSEDRSVESADERIARALGFARFKGPTGNIGRILADIERGRAG